MNAFTPDVSDDDVALLVDAGYLALQTRRWDECGALFEALAGFVPANPHPRIGLAMLRHSQGRRIEAVETLEAVLADFPQAIFTRALLARFQKELGRPDWRDHARRALELESEGLASDIARELLGNEAPPVARTAQATNPASIAPAATTDLSAGVAASATTAPAAGAAPPAAAKPASPATMPIGAFRRA